MENFINFSKIELKNIKNVKNGEIDFKRKVTGIYGQNGSGKTALIDSIDILKSVLCYKNLDYLYDLITVDSKNCNLKFIFTVEIYSRKYQVTLDLTLKKVDKGITGEKVKKVIVEKEILKYSDITWGKPSHKKILIGSDKNELLKNNENFKSLISKYPMNLDVAKILSRHNSVSFLFSDELLKLLEKENYEEVADFLKLFKKFGTSDLIIIKNENLKTINLTPILPEDSFNITDENITIDENFYNDFSKIIENINTMLSSIISNIKLELNIDYKEVISENRTNIILQLFSVRDGRKIPFKHEASGVKKIVSLFSLLIPLSRNKEICLVIDDLDSNIFEYLFGNLLSALEMNSKGQLIFTSNNLRSLEILFKDCLVFTTTNEDEKYMRMKNIKTTNNLRNTYLREAFMHEQKETLYDKANSIDIQIALSKVNRSSLEN